MILTGAALRGANVETSLLLLAYAAGSAVSLAAALLLGGKVFAALKRSLGAEEWIRRALGGAVVVGALAIAFGLDTGFLARVSTASTTRLEEALFARLMPDRERSARRGRAAAGPGDGRQRRDDVGQRGDDRRRRDDVRARCRERCPSKARMPPLDGATQWLNSEPLTREELRGKVVLVDFWTYSCINCIRALPYVEAWHEKYRDQGLVVIGIHSPEFAFEKRPAQRAARGSRSRH